MLIYLIDWLENIFGNVPGAGLFDYITFRAGFAVIISLLISMVFGKRIINYLRKLQIGESVRELGLEGQIQKQGTCKRHMTFKLLGMVKNCCARINRNLMALHFWLAFFRFAETKK